MKNNSNDKILWYLISVQQFTVISFYYNQFKL